MPLFKKNKPPGKLKQWFQKTFGKRVKSPMGTFRLKK